MSTPQLTALDLDDLRCMAESALDRINASGQRRQNLLLAYTLAVDAYIAALKAQATPVLPSPPGAMRLPTDMTT